MSSHENLKRLYAEKTPQPFWGHEFCGEVVELGAGVTNVKLGDRVFYHRGIPCHSCKYCKAGMQNLCKSFINVGEDTPGCLAEYFPIPASTIVAIPDSISDIEACAMQPLVSILGSLQATEIQMGDTVVVIGQGPMGLNSMQVARVAGAGRVIAIARRNEVLDLSRKLGADYGINSTEVDPVEAVMELTNGLGADVVFECAGGSPEQGHAGSDTLMQGFEMLRHEGRIVEIGFLPDGTKISPRLIDKKGIRLVGRRSPTPKMIQYGIDLVASKRVQIEPTVTHVLEGIEQVPLAFEISGNKAKYGAINPPQVRIAH